MLEVRERASPIIWIVFQTTSLNMVCSRPNRLQLKKKLTEDLNHLPAQEELGDGRKKVSLF